MSTDLHTVTATLRAVYTDMDDTDFAPGADALRRGGFAVDYLDTQDAEAIVAGAADATALLVGYAEITADMIARMPRLRVIALMSMGYDNVDVEAARRRGVWVTHIAGAATEEVAAHTLALTLAVTRRLPFYGERVQAGEWNVRDAVVPRRLSQARLGVLGLGRIGARFAELSRPVFGEIVGFDPALPDTAETRERLARAGVRRASLEEVRDTSHVLSLHMPLTAETEGLVDAAFLARMPAGAYLVNVSRGALVDAPAVRAAVDGGHLAGAGLDVLEEEPPPADHPLLGHPAILVTPHVAYLSDVTDREYVRLQAQNVLTWHATGRPDTPVTELP
ncbi:C-terminal binding protein [Georgenia ruanii]|uniref:C-terminal binding protein n=1 Tax=Georgenia ruanii TaxID=348442 RepID=A0A7J9V0Y3_9MICO|nr:C-terminal binding protein [Georgenia ruanii]MPV89624.1 C-terminal binding protein [Georgenia ruanii]